MRVFRAIKEVDTPLVGREVVYQDGNQEVVRIGSV